MPTYVYECRSCGHQFEVFHGINEEPPKSCPRCKKPVRRLITPGGGLIFKGSGFYITDYRKKEYRDKESKERSSSSSTSSDTAKTKSTESTADKPAKNDGGN